MTHRRIDTLDLLRGLAILGTLGTNIWIFTSPAGPAGVTGALTPAGAVEGFLLALTNGKFLALLTLLFGVGLELQYRSAARRGKRPHLPNCDSDRTDRSPSQNRPGPTSASRPATGG